MGIDKFLYILLAAAVAVIFIDVDTTRDVVEKKEKPFMVVENSVVYSINSSNVDRVVESKKFSKFKEAEVLEDGVVVTRVQKDDNLNNVLSAKYMLKQKDNIELIGDVKYDRGHDISLTTSKLNYNTRTKVATNDVEFTAKYRGNDLVGTDLYLDTRRDVIKAKNTHFEIGSKGIE